MTKIKLLMMASGLLFITGISTSILADSIPTGLISQCENVINLSDQDFNNQAANLVSLLDQCNHYNICSQLSETNCASTLQVRDFLSNYYAQLANMGSMQALPPVTPTKNSNSQSLSAPLKTNAPIPQAPTNTNNAPNTNNSNSTPNKQKDIHWF